MDKAFAFLVGAAVGVLSGFGAVFFFKGNLPTPAMRLAAGGMVGGIFGGLVGSLGGDLSREAEAGATGGRFAAGFLAGAITGAFIAHSYEWVLSQLTGLAGTLRY